MKSKAPLNIYKPVIQLRHSDLELYMPKQSMYRVICPICKKGLMLVGRDQKTLEIVPEDICILCGQHVYYTDYKEIEHGRHGLGNLESGT